MLSLFLDIRFSAEGNLTHFIIEITIVDVTAKNSRGTDLTTLKNGGEKHTVSWSSVSSPCVCPIFVFPQPQVEYIVMLGREILHPFLLDSIMYTRVYK